MCLQLGSGLFNGRNSGRIAVNSEQQQRIGEIVFQSLEQKPEYSLVEYMEAHQKKSDLSRLGLFEVVVQRNKRFERRPSDGDQGFHHLIRNIFRIFLYVRNEKRDRIGGIPLPKERNQLGREVDCIAATVTCRKRAHSRKRFFRPIE